MKASFSTYTSPAVLGLLTQREDLSAMFFCASLRPTTTQPKSRRPSALCRCLSQTAAGGVFQVTSLFGRNRQMPIIKRDRISLGNPKRKPDAPGAGRGRLVLHRYPGESFSIAHPDGQIVLTVVECGARLTIAVEAPKSIKVARSELCENAADLRKAVSP
jgi:sRNA-binding carbon storage regulator CsrA